MARQGGAFESILVMGMLLSVWEVGAQIWASHPWHQVAGVPSAQTALATFLRQCPLLGADDFIKGQ